MKKQFSPGRMLSCIHRHTGMYLHKIFAEWGLGSGSHHFLLLLSRNDGLTQQEMTEMLRMDKANTARAIKKLVANGYVSKQQASEDHRAVHIFLTDKGRALIPELRQVLHDWSAVLTEGFSEAEKAETERLLTRMAENAVEHVRKKSP
ncbi:MarR family transcriptional regulator [bacterium]|nr:MarR family transcriptional regulator [bacterium]